MPQVGPTLDPGGTGGGTEEEDEQQTEEEEQTTQPVEGQPAPDADSGVDSEPTGTQPDTDTTDVEESDTTTDTDTSPTQTTQTDDTTTGGIGGGAVTVTDVTSPSIGSGGDTASDTQPTDTSTAGPSPDAGDTGTQSDRLQGEIGDEPQRNAAATGEAQEPNVVRTDSDAIVPEGAETGPPAVDEDPETVRQQIIAQIAGNNLVDRSQIDVERVGEDAYVATYTTTDGETVTERYALSETGQLTFAEQAFESQLAEEGVETDLTQSDLRLTDDGGVTLTKGGYADIFESELAEDGIPIELTANDLTQADGGGFTLTREAYADVLEQQLAAQGQYREIEANDLIPAEGGGYTLEPSRPEQTGTTLSAQGSERSLGPRIVAGPDTGVYPGPAEVGGTFTGAPPIQKGQERGGLRAEVGGIPESGPRFRKSLAAEQFEETINEQRVDEAHVDLSAGDLRQTGTRQVDGRTVATYALTEDARERIDETEGFGNFEIGIPFTDTTLEEVARDVTRESARLGEKYIGGVLAPAGEAIGQAAESAPLVGDQLAYISGQSDLSEFGRSTGRAAGAGLGMVTTLPASTYVLLTETGEYIGEGLAETVQGDFDEYVDRTEAGAANRIARFQDVAAERPGQVLGVALGTTGGITGSIYAAGRLGGLSAARTTSAVLQPGEYAAYAGIRRGAQALRNRARLAQAGATTEFRSLTSDRVAQAFAEGETDVLSEFWTDPNAPTSRAVSEVKTRGEDIPENLADLTGWERGLFRSEADALPTEFAAGPGNYELPGLFTSPDLSPLRLTSSDAETEGFSMGFLPSLGRSNRVTMFRGDRIEGMPERAAESGLARGPEGELRPDPTTTGYEFLTEEADLGTAYVRAADDRTTELEAIYPEGSRFIEADRFAVRMPEGDVAVGRTFRRVESERETEADTETETGVETEGETVRIEDIPDDRLRQSDTYVRTPVSAGETEVETSRRSTDTEVRAPSLTSESTTEIGSAPDRDTRSSLTDYSSVDYSLASESFGFSGSSLSDVSLSEPTRSDVSAASRTSTARSSVSRREIGSRPASGFNYEGRYNYGARYNFNTAIGGRFRFGWDIPDVPTRTRPEGRDGRREDEEEDDDLLTQESQGQRPRPLIPGYLNEYVSALAGSSRRDVAPSQETLEGRPWTEQSAGTLPTAFELENPEAFEQAGELFDFGGGQDDGGGGFL